MRHLTFAFPWLDNLDHQQLLQLLERDEGRARFVGGAVRDSLLGQSPTDFDIATSLSPEQVMDRLTRQGIQVIPTGIRHGTVTAFFNHCSYEITTLREDLQADGRHAVVAYTDSFEADAARRDFTMNALFLDAQATLYDFFEGVEDLRRGCIRFIGDPVRRVEEDHLRILRFFRFQAYFGCKPQGPPLYHHPSLQACLTLKALLGELSCERVTHEWMRLLEAPSPFAVLETLIQEDVVHLLMGFPEGEKESLFKRMRMLEDLERQAGETSPPLVRLFPFSKENPKFPGRLRLPKRHLKALKVWQTLPPPLTFLGVQEALYRLKDVAWVEGSLWLSALDNLEKGSPIEDVEASFKRCITWARSISKPHFPLTGADVICAGVPKGPQVKTWLNTLETWWIQAKFQPDRKACLEELDRLLGE